jgi:hypothetical protein
LIIKVPGQNDDYPSGRGTELPQGVRLCDY